MLDRCCWKISEGIIEGRGNVWSKQNEILATIENFQRPQGMDFQVSLKSDLRKDLQADLC